MNCFASSIRLLIPYLCYIAFSCSQSSHIILAEAFNEITTYKGEYVIKEDIDLKGKTISLPQGCTLVFRGGILRNGVLIGNNTRIKYQGHCFDDIDIKGTWDVPVIKSSMFVSHSFESIKNLFLLQNEKIHNEIIIERGEYHINANTQRAAIILRSNVTLRIDGTIIMDPQVNDTFNNGYYAIYIYHAENVIIKGLGTLIGDLGKSKIQSEYGHGICIFESENVRISGLTISCFHGDGIGVSLNNKNVIIDGLTIDSYYRNGVSIVDGKNISVSNTTIKNGGATDPFAAIDVEPNEGNHISNVKIKNVDISNCRVGIAGYVPKNASAVDVVYDCIRITGISNSCINSSNFTSLYFNNVTITDCGDETQVMRFIGNTYLSLKKVTISAANNKAKYPFYLNSVETLCEDCFFICPQLFSFHLSRARFINSRFKYDSFVWTAGNLTNNDLHFASCKFDGPLFMRPNNVSFINCEFRNTQSSKPYLVCFEEPLGDIKKESSVVMENNTFRLGGSIPRGSAVRSTVQKSLFIKEVFR